MHIHELGKANVPMRAYTVYEMTADAAKLARANTYVMEALKANKFKPIIDRIFSLNQIVAAHEYMESNKQNGKIVKGINA